MYFSKKDTPPVQFAACSLCDTQTPEVRVPLYVREVIGYVDNFPASKHRSKRVRKKLLKRFGENRVLGSGKMMLLPIRVFDAIQNAKG